MPDTHTGTSGREGFFAHTAPEAGGEWQPLEDHLRNVGRLAGDFANAFSAGEFGEAAGLWHDVGKYSEAFQDYLRAADADARDVAPRAGGVD